MVSLIMFKFKPYTIIQQFENGNRSSRHAVHIISVLAPFKVPKEVFNT